MSWSCDGGMGVLGADEVAELYAAQELRVRRCVASGVRAPSSLIEDACQIAWSRLIRDHARVRRDSATGWVIRTATREAFKLLSRGSQELPLDVLTEAGERAIATPSLLDELVEQRSRLDGIRLLPERQQRLVWLHGAGFSYSEMAACTGDTRRTVERQLQKARVALADGDEETRA